MKCAPVFLVAAMTISLAGCVLSGKPKPVAAVPAPPQAAAPAPPPEPLSIPQTQVQLPAPQPVNPDALVTAPALEPARQTPKPQAPARPPAPRNANNAAPPKPPETQPAPAEPAEPVREQIREIVPPDEARALKERAHKNRVETQAILVAARPQTSNQRRAAAEIRQFLKQSEQAEGTGDMRLADQLAERANILAKELQSGK